MPDGGQEGTRASSRPDGEVMAPDSTVRVSKASDAVLHRGESSEDLVVGGMGELLFVLASHEGAGHKNTHIPSQ